MKQIMQKFQPLRRTEHVKRYVPSSLLSSLTHKTWERGVITEYDRQDILGMPLCKEHKQWHYCATYKICSVLFGMLSLCCLVCSVVDHMLVISGGFFMVVYMLFQGYSLATLCYFVMGGFASGLCCFVYEQFSCYSFTFLFILHDIRTCSIHVRKLNIIIPLHGCPIKYTWWFYYPMYTFMQLCVCVCVCVCLRVCEHEHRVPPNWHY